MRQLSSGRWQVRLYDPETGKQRSPGIPFETAMDARAWLADYARGEAITPTPVNTTTLADYSRAWLAARELKPRTEVHYAAILQRHILPTLGDLRIDRITPTHIRSWYGRLNPHTPVIRAHAYALLRTILGTAVADDLVPTNPCRIRGAGTSTTAHSVSLITLPELSTMVENMHDRFRTMVLLGAWCGLRLGEVTELRRSDLQGGVVRVTRGVTRVPGRDIVGTPKSRAGTRAVSIPPHLLPVIEAHLGQYVGREPSALLFPAARGGHLSGGSFAPHWHRAREAAGRPDIHFHDLRHLGARPSPRPPEPPWPI